MIKIHYGKYYLIYKYYDIEANNRNAFYSVREDEPQGASEGENVKAESWLMQKLAVWKKLRRVG